MFLQILKLHSKKLMFVNLFKKDLFKAFYLYFLYFILIFIFVFLSLNSLSTPVDFNLMLFGEQYSYIYTWETNQLTCRSLISHLLICWFSFTRLAVLSYCLYIYVFIIILYKTLTYINKGSFSIIDETNITNAFVLKFFRFGSFCNLIPGFQLWSGLSSALRFRYNLSLNSYFTYSMLTVYREGKNFSWSNCKIDPSTMETTIDKSILNQVSLPSGSSLDKAPILNSLFKKQPNLFNYKQAILSGDLRAQKAILHDMSSLEIDIVLNSQTALWMNFFSERCFDRETIDKFNKNADIKAYFKQSICDIESIFFAKATAKNCYFVHGKQIPGFTMYHNASNLNKFHRDQEFSLCKTHDFIDEKPILFKNRIRQTLNKLQEINHACNAGIHDSLFVSPSERAIRSDSYLVSSGDFNIEELKYIFEEEYTFQTRFSLPELSLIAPNSKIVCLDFTKGVQRQHFNSEEEFLLFIKGILVDNKVSPLLTDSTLISKQEYVIVADFVFFKSDVSKFKVDEAFYNINQSVNNLKGTSNISVNITWSIIDDVWNL